MTTAEPLPQSSEALTIPRLLRRNAQEFAQRPALSTGFGPDAGTLTWTQLRAEVAALTRGLVTLGLDRGDRVLIAMSKRAEHWIADLAAVHIGALPCSTYDTLSTAQIGALARHSAATVLALEGEEQMRRWRPVLKDLPHLRAVVILDWDAAPADDPRFVGYSAVRGALPPDDSSFEALTDAADPDQPLALVYTSGTTGDPKGVVLSHRNVVHESLMQDELVPVPEHPRTVAYLPMAHIAERVLGVYMPICNAGHVTICPEPAQLMPALLAVRPHGFFGVPRVWEKLAAGLRAQLATLPGEQATAVAHARKTALEAYRLRSEGEAIPAELARTLEQQDTQVLRPILAAIGFDRCHRAFSGAAPIPPAVLEFLASIGLPVYEVWGLGETTGAVTVSTPESFALGSVGRPGPGIEVREADDGELFVRGPVVFSGYLQADGRVETATDAEGWLPTGDVGTVDSRGIVTLTDRKREIIITAGGKNIAPTRIESLLRAHPLVAQAVAIGDGRRYVTALLVLDEEAAPLWARANGIAAADPIELSRHPEVVSALDELVSEVNGVLSHAEQVKQHRVLPGPWTTETGELTPKLSLRRRAVDHLHAATIESMYT
ncbi:MULTISPECIES: AMP-dependent synthetase/ligase [Streptomyces]|uniref:Acyl-CoA synthetase n=1 Tax=Streptomyces clavifer TaxID=68188 RepID=A0ABS4VIC1_9ACTN|nr:MULTISPECIES: AMP-dependent synthetase/ligase [Streptomyces]MBP2363681.1 long-chain acyl-CoA synthetase [Streptomyces clavifer]MDX2747343.1 AMP-dependent synthetase/ligase [Streptomyces sp. NRRL_B-2557]GHB26089.1 long-chain acyl-CoA synthetase [Streptomyces clavifer]